MILFLNSIGIWEILLIMMIVLMLFGANSIPSIARNLGRGVRQMRDVSQDIQRDINTSTHKMKEDFNKQIEPPSQKESRQNSEKKKPESNREDKPEEPNQKS